MQGIKSAKLAISNLTLLIPCMEFDLLSFTLTLFFKKKFELLHFILQRVRNTKKIKNSEFGIIQGGLD